MKRLVREINYWADVTRGSLQRKPAWTVTWPTLPGGVYTIGLKSADSVDDAIQQARGADAPTAPGYRIDYGATPSVYQVKPGPARRVFGPDYYGDDN